VSKKNLTDGSPETCWASQAVRALKESSHLAALVKVIEIQQGLPQYIQLTFPSPVIPRRVGLTFQGGFVGSKCAVQILSQLEQSVPGSEWCTMDTIYPEDINAAQIFVLESPSKTDSQTGVTQLRLVFEQSSDFFGRVTVYDLTVEGEALS
jgi:hypothetical protein